MKSNRFIHRSSCIAEGRIVSWMYDKYNDLLARLEEPLVKPRGRSRFHKLMHLLSFVHAFTIHFQVCSTSNSYSYSYSYSSPPAMVDSVVQEITIML